MAATGLAPSQRGHGPLLQMHDKTCTTGTKTRTRTRAWAWYRRWRKLGESWSNAAADYKKGGERDNQVDL